MARRRRRRVTLKTFVTAAVMSLAASAGLADERAADLQSFCLHAVGHSPDQCRCMTSMLEAPEPPVEKELRHLFVARHLFSDCTDKLVKDSDAPITPDAFLAIKESCEALAAEYPEVITLLTEVALTDLQSPMAFNISYATLMAHINCRSDSASKPSPDAAQ